jgi:O-antigen/teichoic acid export membrane protein
VIITTRILVPRQYAVIGYVTVVAGLMFNLTSGWTATAVARYGREELEQTGVMNRTSWNRLLATVPQIVLFTAVIVLVKLSGGLPGEMSWTFVGVAIASGLLLILSEHVVTLLEAAGRMRFTAVALTSRQVIATGALVLVLASGHGHSPLVVLAVTLIALSLVIVVMAARVWRVALWPPSFDRQLMRRMLVFSLPMVIFAVSQYVIQSVDIVILRALGTRTQTGVYTVAYQGYMVLQQIPTTITIVLTPLFVSLGTARQGATIARYVSSFTAQLTFLTAALASLAIPFLGLAASVVFGARFTAAGRPLALLFVALVLYAAESFLAPILVLHERTRAIAIINALAAVINIAADLLFVGPLHMGVLGPALATAIALAVVLVGYLVTAELCVGERGPRRVLWLAPLVVATVPVLLLSPGAALGVGLPAAVLVTAAVVRWASPFVREDADIVAKLDLPAPAKRIVVRWFARVAR